VTIPRVSISQLAKDFSETEVAKVYKQCRHIAVAMREKRCRSNSGIEDKSAGKLDKTISR
jgi:hypothetical protein